MFFCAFKCVLTLFRPLDSQSVNFKVNVLRDIHVVALVNSWEMCNQQIELQGRRESTGEGAHAMGRGVGQCTFTTFRRVALK